jgi:hypothetical protein
MATLVETKSNAHIVDKTINQSGGRWNWAVAWLAILLVVVGYVVWGGIGLLTLPAANVGFKDAAVVLAIITGLAVAIERGMEAFWIATESLPQKNHQNSAPIAVGLLIDRAVDEVTSASKPFLEEALAEIGKAEQTTAESLAKIEFAKQRLATLKSDLAHLKMMAPWSPQMLELTRFAMGSVSDLQRYYPNLETVGDAANRTLGVLADLLTTMSHNPDRRIIGILAGASIGVVVAAVLGLDLFLAALEAPTAGRWGIAVTGLVVGFGANPTHDIIRALQEYKEKRKRS